MFKSVLNKTNYIKKLKQKKLIDQVKLRISQKKKYSTNASEKVEKIVKKEEKKELTEEEEIKKWDEEYYKIPEEPLIAKWMGKFVGALTIFWVLYFFDKNGKILLGLERPHWEHPMNDSVSEDDDEFWSETESDDEIEIALENFMRTPSNNPELSFKEHLEDLVSKVKN